MSIQKLYLLIGIVVASTTRLCAQEMYYNQFIGSNKMDKRETEFDKYSHGVIAAIGFGYIDTLSSRWNYKVGIDYMTLSDESYYSDLEFERESIDGDTITFTTRVGDYYDSHNIAFTLGGLYWPTKKRKGFYIPTELISVFTVSAQLQEYRVGDDTFVERSYFDATDDYNSIHLHIRTGIGYKLVVYRGFSISASYLLLFRFGKVVREVDDSFAFNRGITLMAGYKF